MPCASGRSIDIFGMSGASWRSGMSVFRGRGEVVLSRAAYQISAKSETCRDLSVEADIAHLNQFTGPPFYIFSIKARQKNRVKKDLQRDCSNTFHDNHIIF